MRALRSFVTRPRFASANVHLRSEEVAMKYGLLWLLGIPLPIVLLLWFFLR